MSNTCNQQFAHHLQITILFEEQRKMGTKKNRSGSIVIKMKKTLTVGT